MWTEGVVASVLDRIRLHCYCSCHCHGVTAQASMEGTSGSSALMRTEGASVCECGDRHAVGSTSTMVNKGHRDLRRYHRQSGVHLRVLSTLVANGYASAATRRHQPLSAWQARVRFDRTRHLGM